MVDFGSFEYCCGAMEIGNFEGSAQQIKASILGEIQACKANFDEGYDGDAPGLLVATTVATQKEAIKALKSLKFREVLTFLNPGTQNKVTLWTRKLTY